MSISFYLLVTKDDRPGRSPPDIAVQSKHENWQEWK